MDILLVNWNAASSNSFFVCFSVFSCCFLRNATVWGEKVITSQKVISIPGSWYGLQAKKTKTKNRRKLYRQESEGGGGGGGLELTLSVGLVHKINLQGS